MNTLAFLKVRNINFDYFINVTFVNFWEDGKTNVFAVVIKNIPRGKITNCQ